jgi:molybdopterin-guanine dinucleotide biosynthesis adapter protein
MKIFGLAGRSGSGKTTLLIKLIPELVRHGITVSTMKHAHHGFDIDRPGKDSYEHRMAGATEVLVSSPYRWALLHEHRSAPEPTYEELVGLMAPVDLLLVEGWKFHDHPKLEISRVAPDNEPLWPDDPYIVAVASDGPLGDIGRPVLPLDDIAGIADFIVDHLELNAG